MAEAVVSFVLGKLGDVIVNEIQFLGGVGEKVRQVQRELIRIQCCLVEADSKREGDAMVQNWLNELCDVAYRIEDAIDTFFLKVEDNRQKDLKLLQKLNRMGRKLFKVPILHTLGTELDNIQNELKNIFESRVNYGIKDLPDDKGKQEAVIMPLRRATYSESEVDETEVVGLLSHKDNILKLLRDKGMQRRTVITIVGPGGLGKTTLAHMVYKSAKSEFEDHIMLSISQHFILIDLLRNMLRQLQHSIPENQDVGYLIKKLQDLLSSRRYLIFLDDVWDVKLWIQLKDVLPDDKNGSRVMMTSRLRDVAKLAEPNMEPYELRFLNNEESRDLLLKKALCSLQPDKDCPSDLLELVDDLSEKCKGLPLALIVLGGILSTKQRSYPAWKGVLRTMTWPSDGKDYHKISAKKLIRMWIAEGFIPRESSRTMEETAEVYLEELFQRCMLQVTSRSTNCSIKYFQVHDLLRDLAMHEARQQNFLTIFYEASNVNLPNRGTRRASLQYCNPQFMEYVGPNTRSILTLGLEVPKFFHLRLLRVVELESFYQCPDMVSMGFEELIYLKYFGIRNADVTISLDFLCRMKALETLNIKQCYGSISDKAFWTISTLRHVRIEGYNEGPPSTANLKNLQTLKWIEPSRTWAKALPILDNLCTLGIIYEFDDWVPLTNLLGTLPSLVTLKIKGLFYMAKPLPKEIIYPNALPNYQNLQSLLLQGIWPVTVTLEASMLPPHLLKLELSYSDFQQDPTPELGKLKSLKKLFLENVMDSSYSGPTMCPAGFPVLQYLKVFDKSRLMDEFTVAQGVMPKLKMLEIRSRTKLHLPPELQHVTITNYLHY